jgi:hypothetical protein
MGGAPGQAGAVSGCALTSAVWQCESRARTALSRHALGWAASGQPCADRQRDGRRARGSTHTSPCGHAFRVGASRSVRARVGTPQSARLALSHVLCRRTPPLGARPAAATCSVLRQTCDRLPSRRSRRHHLFREIDTHPRDSLDDSCRSCRAIVHENDLAFRVFGYVLQRIGVLEK